MEIKDQLKTRMEQLKMPVSTLAKALGVSNQSVRHWLNGRSFPGKKQIPEIERTLSFKLDFSEGQHSELPTTEQVLDLELFVKINKLSPEFKREVCKLVEMIIAAEARGSPVLHFAPPIPVAPRQVVETPSRRSGDKLAARAR